MSREKKFQRFFNRFAFRGRRLCGKRGRCLIVELEETGAKSLKNTFAIMKSCISRSDLKYIQSIN